MGALGRFEDTLFDQQLIFANQPVAVDLQPRQSVNNLGIAFRLRLPEKLLLFENIFVFRFFVVWNSFFSLSASSESRSLRTVSSVMTITT